MKVTNLMIALCACVFLVWCGTKNLSDVTAPAVDVVNDVADAVEEWVDNVMEGAEEAGNDASGIIDALKERNEIQEPAGEDIDEVAGEDTAGEVTYVIDTDASTLNWEAGKIVPGGDHAGTVDIKEGSAVYMDNMLQSASAVLDMTTIVSDSAWLDGHLKNEDFFDVENHPEATIVITSTEKVGDITIATADLTIKWITNVITFPVVADENWEMAEFTIDRTLWDIKYGSATFFDDLADKAIKDDIEFEINIAYVTE